MTEPTKHEAVESVTERSLDDEIVSIYTELSQRDKARFLDRLLSLNEEELYYSQRKKANLYRNGHYWSLLLVGAFWALTSLSAILFVATIVLMLIKKG